MRTNTITLIFITFFLSVMNMNVHAQYDGKVLEDTIYSTPNGDLRVIIEERKYGYSLYIKEMTQILPQLWEVYRPYAPFSDSHTLEFRDTLKKTFASLICSNYPLVKDAIINRKIRSFSLEMCFDDRKELINKSFDIFVDARELPVIHQVVKEIVSDDRLTTLIQQGAEEIYRLFPPTKREELPEEIKAVLAEGELDFWGAARISINNEDDIPK